MGLRVGCSFELDPLMLKLFESQLVIEQAAQTQIIQAAGRVELDDTTIFRFYTDDEAFLQVVAQGGTDDTHVIDVKLYHYYDTLDISADRDWDALLNTKIGVAHYELSGYGYDRVWQSLSDYHKPVHMRESTYDIYGASSFTDQFTMLFERPVTESLMESLLLSAEETLNPAGGLSRCFVISTGVDLSPSQITIHG